MCTSILLRDLFSEPAHCGWHAGKGEDQHNPDQKWRARHFAGERQPIQEVMELENCITTSYRPMTTFHTARRPRGFWLKPTMTAL
jgi:hypothetical protein